MEHIKPLYIAVDFDGTIVENRYPEIGNEIPFAIDTLKLIQSELRHNLILWTVREGQELESAVNFCKERGLTFYAVNNNYPREKSGKEARKLMADLFIDDRNFGGMPDWGFIFSSLKYHPDKCLSQDIYNTHAGEKKSKKWRLFK